MCATELVRCVRLLLLANWPEPYIYTVYDRAFGNFPAKITVCTPYIYMVLANPTFGMCPQPKYANWAHHGAMSTRYHGAMSTSYRGAMSTSYRGVMSTGYHGAMSTSYHRAMSTSYGRIVCVYAGEQVFICMHVSVSE